MHSPFNLKRNPVIFGAGGKEAAVLLRYERQDGGRGEGEEEKEWRRGENLNIEGAVSVNLSDPSC